jgi:hypothetical protein
MVKLEDLDSPDSHKTIWRYMDLSKLISLIENSELYFSRVDNYEDPLDGWLPVEDYDKESDVTFPTDDEVVWENRKLVYTNCWTIDEGQSDAMWKSYLSSNKGVAIQTDVEKLESQLPDHRDIHVKKVKYYEGKELSISDYMKNPLLPAFYKRKAYEHENELRLALRLTYEDDEVILGEGYVKKTPKDRRIGINPESLIDKIHTSPKAPEWFTRTIEKMVNTYDLDIEVEQSKLLNPPFETRWH